MRLDGKVAFVTGAASGLGKGIAEIFAQAGAAVVIADLNEAGACSVAAAIQARGGRALGVGLDVAAEAAVDAGVRAAIDAFGGIDILVANAGIQIVHPVHEFPFDEWRRLLAIHLDGAFLCTKACLKPMYASGKGGVIIYMGSVHSKEASVLKSAYVAAKHGIAGLAKVVAKEGAAKGVRSHVICPGFVRTPLVEKQIPEQAQTLGISADDVVKKVMLKDTVDGIFTTVDDVAQVALFLAAFPSAALTGQSVVVSHGWHMS